MLWLEAGSWIHTLLSKHNLMELELLMNLVWTALKAGELEQSIEFYEQSLLVMGDIDDRHGVAAVSMGLGMAAHFRGEFEKVQPLLTEAQTNFREGVGG